MIRSMTAFGGSEVEINGYCYAWEIRSVNHRYLDINFRIPESLRVLEARFRSQIGKQLRRGKVDCCLNYQPGEASSASIQIDSARLEHLVRVVERIESVLPKAVPCSALEVLQWPGIQIEQRLDPEELALPLVDLLQSSVAKVVESREREGASLEALIAERCRQLEEQVESVRARLPEIAARQRERLLAKLATLSNEIDPLRFEQEVVILLHKMDVDEEMERLATHIVEVGRVLKSDDVAGRRIDFLLQEMNREANTLGSKSVDNETTKACVEMKVLIEQMREQVQNIE